VYRSYAVQKKLTITIDEDVYEGLRKTIGPRNISRFVQEIVRPHVVPRPNLEAAYAEMAKDRKREKETAEWARLDVTFMSESSLSKDWLRPEEEKTWQHL
jgi:predicted CopG family antitoxin